MAKKVIKPKFDWGGFKLIGGMGIVFSAFGAGLFWITYTAPQTGPSDLYALTASQRLVRMIPPEVNERIAIVISALFVLFGVFLVMNALYRAIRFILFKK